MDFWDNHCQRATQLLSIKLHFGVEVTVSSTPTVAERNTVSNAARIHHYSRYSKNEVQCAHCDFVTGVPFAALSPQYLGRVSRIKLLTFVENIMGALSLISQSGVFPCRTIQKTLPKTNIRKL